jgi:hypothetical protein
MRRRTAKASAIGSWCEGAGVWMGSRGATGGSTVARALGVVIRKPAVRSCRRGGEEHSITKYASRQELTTPKFSGLKAGGKKCVRSKESVDESAGLVPLRSPERFEPGE